MKKLLIFTLLFISYSIGNSQNITGSLQDNNDQPIAYANVLLLHAADTTLYKGVLSEEDGGFTFEQVAQGNYLLQATSVGFGDYTSDVISLEGSEEVNLPIVSMSGGVAIDEVVVVAKKPFIELKADKMIVNVANSSINAGNSALEVLEKSPGVVVDNNKQISLRGKQGVLVMINGKNQYMSGQEITRLLENMPASNIQNLEIITNPSAKYDAEGNSGIINIVLKKNEKLGSNGNISTTLRQGRRLSHFHNLRLNYRSEKLNVYGSGEYYNWGKKEDLDLTRNIPQEGGFANFSQESDMQEGGDGYNIRLGADYQLTSKTSIGVLAKRNSGDELDSIVNETKISGTGGPAFSTLDVVTEGLENYERNTYNANLKHKLNEKGMEIVFDTDLSMYKNDEMLTYDNFFSDDENMQVDDPIFLRNDRGTVIDIFASKVDLTIPVNDKINLETGAKYSDVNTENNTLFEVKEGDAWVNQTNRSNDFMYREKVWAGYINGSTSIAYWMVQGGLRMERTYSKGTSVTTATVVPRTYTNFFPSISLSRMIGEQNNLSLTYSRRLERPHYNNLNPFENYLDQYTLSKGNPFLNPQYSNAFGLNFALGRKLFIAANYSHTTDAMTSVIEQINEENTTYQTNQNLDDQRNLSLTMSAPKVWTEWFTSRANYTAFYSEFNSVIPSGTLDNSSLAHIADIQNELNLPGGWNMEVALSYQSRLIFGLFEVSPQTELDLGFSKRILNNKGNIKISISDLFYSSNSPVRINQDDIDLYILEQNDSRRVSVNFSYRFGNDKVKAAKKRRTAAEDEGGRI